MLYLNEADIRTVGIDWSAIATVIRKTCYAMAQEDFAQPIKPYLRYRNKRNRIIAMPGFVGGDTELAGIKWIASFPENVDKGIKRAHSVTILNDADTGQPVSIINTPLLSGIRTAGVSGLVLQLWLEKNLRPGMKVGMTGLGPIGQLHADMIFSMLKENIEALYVYDIRPFDKEVIAPAYTDKITVCNSWQEAFDNADIFITCTVSDKPYINHIPKKGSLHLNVSLRDYEASWIQYADMIIVDDWEEVCRENTDIEMMHLHYGLQKEEAYNIIELLSPDGAHRLAESATVMFNPMGMAVFDIAVAGHFLAKAKEGDIGTRLN